MAHRVSVALDANTQGGTVVIHGKDAESMKLFHEKLLEFASRDPIARRSSKASIAGIQAYQINGVHVGVYEDRLLVTNKSELGKQVIDRLIDGGDSLLDNPRFQTAQ